MCIDSVVPRGNYSAVVNGGYYAAARENYTANLNWTGYIAECMEKKEAV